MLGSGVLGMVNKSLAPEKGTDLGVETGGGMRGGGVRSGAEKEIEGMTEGAGTTTIVEIVSISVMVMILLTQILEKIMKLNILKMTDIENPPTTDLRGNSTNESARRN